MPSFVLNWMPAGGLNSTGQQVQYKESTSGTWITATTLGSLANTHTIDSLLDNVFYDFRIVNVCLYGGPTNGTTITDIALICPSISITPSFNNVSFSFPELGGSITGYTVHVLNAAGNTVIATKTPTPSGGTVADSFTGLSAETDYNLRLTITAGARSQVCTMNEFTTAALPTCDAPTSLNVTIEAEEE